MIELVKTEKLNSLQRLRIFFGFAYYWYIKLLNVTKRKNTKFSLDRFVCLK